MSSSILLNVLDIYLDSENPRHDPIYDQPKIIKHLLKGHSVKNLARHISQHGMNPLDAMGVVKDEEENFVVVEGNRRMCALLLLNDPNKAPAGEVPYFKRLAENSSKVPPSINCILFDDNTEAYIWMGIRHNGEQEGVGIKSWDSKQKTRHNGRVNNKDQNALALTLINYAIKKDMLHAENSNRIITTAARYLGNPFIRETFGIVSARSDQDVMINVVNNEFDKVLTRFCDDLVENKTVNSRTRKDDWLAYGRLLIEEGVAPKERIEPHLLGSNNQPSEPEANPNNPEPKQGSTTASPSNNKDAGTDSGTTSSGGNTGGTGTQPDKTNGRGQRNPDKRKFIVPPDFRPTINNKILRRAFEEMKTINVDEKPLAIALLTRAFLENVFILFDEKVTGHYHPQQTHKLMGKAIKEIELDSTSLSKIEKNAVAALKRVQSNEMNVLSPKTLGANAHAGIYPDPAQLKREFDNIAAIISYMLKRL